MKKKNYPVSWPEKRTASYIYHHHLKTEKFQDSGRKKRCFASNGRQLFNSTPKSYNFSLGLKPTIKGVVFHALFFT